MAGNEKTLTFFGENARYLLLALVLALLSFFAVTGRERIETWVDAPLVISNAPRQLVVTGGMVNRVAVRVSGPAGLVRDVSAERLAYQLDLEELVPGENVIVLDPANVSLPGPLDIEAIEPARLTLQVDERVSVSAPVEVATTGALPEGWVRKSSSTLPGAVRLTGPASVLAGVEEVRTRPLALDGSQAVLYRQSVGLELPALVASEPATVEAVVIVGPQSRPIWIKVDLQVEATAAGLGVRGLEVQAEHVRVEVDMPLPLLVDNTFRDDVRAHLPREVLADVVEQAREAGPGAFVAEVPFRVSLPPHAVLLEANPRTVRVVVDPTPLPQS